MKLQKIILIVCFIITTILLVALFYLDQKCKLYDICVGILTGIFLTVITTTVFYYYEKNKFLNKIYNKYSEIYFALCNLDKYLGEFLVVKEIADSKFGINYTLTSEINNIANSFDFEEYDSFFSKDLDNIITNLNNFKTRLYNLNQITAKRVKGILEHEAIQKDIEYKRLQGFNEQMLALSFQLAKERRDSILILVAKLHEYSVSLKIELDDLLTSLDKVYNFNSKWVAKKEFFNEEINSVNNLSKTEGK